MGIHNIDLTIVENNGIFYGFHKPGDVEDKMGNLMFASESLKPGLHTFGKKGNGKVIFENETKPTEGTEKWLRKSLKLTIPEPRAQGVCQFHFDMKVENQILFIIFHSFLRQDRREFWLSLKNGIITQITNYGGRVVTLWTPDKNGSFEDIVLGYETIDGYLNSNEIYFGALIGRYGNRIAKGKFTLNEKEYTMATNNDKNHLHGGVTGFNNVVWDATQIDDKTLALTYVSEDMEEGYPGNLKVKVIYTLTDNDELKVEYWAITDAPTFVNLTHHSFFNLHGAGNGSINDHILQINADDYTPVDPGLIPTGQISTVNNTPMDFTTATAIGDRVENNFEQLKFGLGYDHNWVLNQSNSGLTKAAKITEPKSGRTIEVFTNEPGMQFYGGNFLDGSDTGKYGLNYEHRTAFCLETQHFPDSPNQPNFLSTLLNPGEEYHSICIKKFSVN